MGKPGSAVPCCFGTTVVTVLQGGLTPIAVHRRRPDHDRACLGRLGCWCLRHGNAPQASKRLSAITSFARFNRCVSSGPRATATPTASTSNSARCARREVIGANTSGSSGTSASTAMSASRAKRRAGHRDRDHLAAYGARDLDAGNQVARAPAARDGHHHVVRAQHRRRHGMHMRVGMGGGGHAQAEELVLRIQRDDARVALPPELDAPRGRQRGDGGLQRGRVEMVAHFHQRADGAVEDLGADVGGAVVRGHVAVHEGDAARPGSSPTAA